MRAGIKASIATSAVAIGLVAPAGASAVVKTYAGSAQIGGAVAMDVKVSKRGVAKQIIALRAKDLPATCEISGPNVLVDLATPAAIKVDSEGKFSFELTDSYGNKSTLSGKFKGPKDKNVRGKLLYASHFPAEGPYPEENCATADSGFHAVRGATDTTTAG